MKPQKMLFFCMLSCCIMAAPAALMGTEVTLYSIADSYVNDNAPSTNYGSSGTIGVGDLWGHSPAYICRGYLKFDLSSIPSGSVINSAKLYIGSTASGGTPDIVVGAHYLDDDSWTENGITWNNAPTSFNGPSTDNAVVDNKAHNLQCCDCWCLTEDVQTALDDDGILSEVLKTHSSQEGTTNIYCQLCSKEDGTGQGYEPRLVITYGEQIFGTVNAGTDCWVTSQAQINFGTSPEVSPIPDSFFGPGSDPFDGVIYLTGSPINPPISNVDTQIERKVGADPPETIDIELVALNLVSTAPITVSFWGGMEFYQYDVAVTLGGPADGSMDIKGNDQGGTFNFYMFVNMMFEFTPIDGGPQPSPLVQSVPMSIDYDYPWQDDPIKYPEIVPCNDNDFYPSGDQSMVVTYHMPGDPFDAGSQTMYPPRTVQTNFLISSEEDWTEVLVESPGKSYVRPMTEPEWLEYMSQFNNPANLEGDPYIYDEFREAVLTPCGGGGGGGCQYAEAGAGLLMVWGRGDEVLGGRYPSAFIYEYGEDPDLSNSTITVTVEPPCGCGINTISLGLQDINNRIRSWTWNVVPGAPGAGAIQCSPIPPAAPILTTVTIDLSKTGVTAATPQAASYSNYNAPPNPLPAFNITNVQQLIFDENATWLASIPPPPKGAGGAWNYWRNLSVKPNVGGGGGAAVNSKWFIKWSQPPVEYENKPGFIHGWDEWSVYHQPPLMADDWMCQDERPITDIHWWGSFRGWTQPILPPPHSMPKAFQLGIWTDVPAGVDSNYSHPGVLVWENYCDNYVWNFAGHDLLTPEEKMHVPDYVENETCFQFTQLLSQDEWFDQGPGETGEPNQIFWLSIAAIYDDPLDVEYMWGWKTRPHFFQDDAVRILSLADGTWPPKINAVGVGSAWGSGIPIQIPPYPAPGVTWDLAFELTTNEPGYEDDPIPGDLNLDRRVDLLDFAIFTNHWLQTEP